MTPNCAGIVGICNRGHACESCQGRSEVIFIDGVRWSDGFEGTRKVTQDELEQLIASAPESFWQGNHTYKTGRCSECGATLVDFDRSRPGKAIGMCEHAICPECCEGSAREVVVGVAAR